MANPPIKIGLALGGGGARGIAHIWAVKAVEELGLEIDVIAGTSIGAIVGAGYASGMGGDDLLEFVKAKLRNTANIAAQIFSASASDLVDLLNPFKPALLNGEMLIDILMDDHLHQDFSKLRIDLKVMTTNFYQGTEHIITKGDLRLAVAASSAIPAIFTPVVIGHEIFIDGAYCNPVPYSAILDDCDLCIAINVNGRPTKKLKTKPKLKDMGIVKIPQSREVLFSSNQIMQNRIMREKLKISQPQIYINAPIDQFKVMDFNRAQEILEATMPMKEQLKRQISAILDA